VQGASLFTSAASNQRGCPEDSPSEVQFRLPEAGVSIWFQSWMCLGFWF